MASTAVELSLEWKQHFGGFVRFRIQKKKKQQQQQDILSLAYF